MMQQAQPKAQRRGQMPQPSARRADVFDRVGKPLPTSYHARLNKVIQMDRRGHAMPGMDAVYTHVTQEMRQRLCEVLEDLWHDAVMQRRRLAQMSAVPLLNEILAGRDG
jgi:hypothetical protein